MEESLKDATIAELGSIVETQARRIDSLRVAQRRLRLDEQYARASAEIGWAENGRLWAFIRQQRLFSAAVEYLESNS